MDIRSLRLFCHLATSLHFGQTSAALHVSAPTLSRAIQRLEAEVGEALFTRDNRKVQLTPAGQSLQFTQRVQALKANPTNKSPIQCTVLLFFMLSQFLYNSCRLQF